MDPLAVVLPSQLTHWVQHTPFKRNLASGTYSCSADYQQMRRLRFSCHLMWRDWIFWGMAIPIDHPKTEPAEMK